MACTSASACTAVGNQTLVKTLAERWNGRRWQVQATPNPSGGQNIFLAGVACPARTVCTAFGLNLTGSGPLTLAERWSGGRWRIQPTPGLVAYDIGFPGVACPTPSACYAVASYTNNGPSLTLVEPWNQAGTGTQVATGPSVAPGALSPACLRGRTQGPLPISGAIPAAAWSRFRVGSFLSRAGLTVASQPYLVRSWVTLTDPATVEVSCRQPTPGSRHPAMRFGLPAGPVTTGALTGPAAARSPSTPSRRNRAARPHPCPRLAPRLSLARLHLASQGNLT